MAWLVVLATAPTGAATPTVAVPALACSPNASQPVQPVTLDLLLPGDRLNAPGLILFGQNVIRPDSLGEFAYRPFGPDDYAFDRVNVVWHAQQFLKRLARYGLDPEEKPIFLHVEPGAGSYTHYLEPITTIGTGIGNQDRGAKDSDIIVHEITHAVFNPRLPLGTYPLDKGEAGPLLEGLADYFAAAVNGDTRIGEFAKPPNGYHDIASDPQVYNYSRWDVLPPDSYSRGRVLNGALLEIRDVIGETADELVYGALDYSPLRCFTCFADAMRTADADRHGGANRAVLDAAFSRRGIGSGPPDIRPIVAPKWCWLGDEVVVRSLYRCGIGPFRGEWRLQREDGSSETIPNQGDTLQATLFETTVIQFTLWDRENVPHAAAPCTVRVYDPNSPDVHVSGIRIVGPTTVDAGKLVDYSYELTGGRGIPPATVTWSGLNLSVTALSNGNARVFPAPTSGMLKARYRDAIGQLVADSIVITTVASFTISPIVGPVALQAGEPTWYRVTPVGGYPPYRYAWSQRDVDGAVTLPDSSSVLSLRSTKDFTLHLSVLDSRDTQRSTQLAVRSGPLLSLRGVEGQTVIESGKPGRFRVLTNGGLPPFRYRWLQQGASGSFILPDSAEIGTRPVDRDFLLSVQVSDSRQSTVMWGVQVLVFSPPPPPPPPPPPSPIAREFRVLQSVLRRGGPVPFELPTPDAAGQLEVLDASGRIRASVSLSSSPPPTYDLPLPSDLHSGVYFVRLRRSDRTFTSRFVLLTR